MTSSSNSGGAEINLTALLMDAGRQARNVEMAYEQRLLRARAVIEALLTGDLSEDARSSVAKDWGIEYEPKAVEEDVRPSDTEPA